MPLLIPHLRTILNIPDHRTAVHPVLETITTAALLSLNTANRLATTDLLRADTTSNLACTTNSSPIRLRVATTVMAEVRAVIL